jgi:thiol-disulfide isomerase/thioredoxin
VNLRPAVAALAATAFLLTGCTSTDKLAADYGSAGSSQYTDDSGMPLLIKPADRAAPISFDSKTEDGTPLKLAAYRGTVVVVNFWYAGCAPCRAEAPILEGLNGRYQKSGVTFVGVNTTDQPAAALSFEKKYQVTYPSVMDVESGSARIAFAGSVAPTAVPTTFVLDPKGRIAARITGELQSPSILNTLISDTLAEAK